MLSGSEEEQSTRRPFEFLTNIFKRRREHDCETETEDEASRPPDITLHGASLTVVLFYSCSFSWQVLPLTATHATWLIRCHGTIVYTSPLRVIMYSQVHTHHTGA